MTETITVTPEQVHAARLEVAINNAAGLDSDPLVASLAKARPVQDFRVPPAPEDSALSTTHSVGVHSQGYRAATACAAAGITYRQLDYWARTGVVEPSLDPRDGERTERLYSFRDILALKLVKKLLDAGVPLQNVRTALDHLRERGVDDLTQITLITDGVTVYEFTSADDVVDLLQGGQIVLGVALARIAREVDGSLAQLPSEQRPLTSDSDARTPTSLPRDGAA